MRSRGKFKKVIVPGILFLIILSSSALSFASVDISKEIAALKEEIKTAQEKIDKAKLGQTLEAITLPVSIKNMQKIFGSLSQKTAGDPNLSAKVKNLNSSLNALEGAKNKNDKQNAQKLLNDMAGTVKGFETGLPPTTPVAEKVEPGIAKGPTSTQVLYTVVAFVDPTNLHQNSKKSDRVLGIRKWAQKGFKSGGVKSFGLTNLR